MESIRLFEETREEDVFIEAPYVFSLQEKTYVPSKKSVTAATISVDGTVTEEKIEVAQPNNEIWYTTTDGNVLDFSVYNGGAENVTLPTILSNVYEDGKGVVTFSEDVTYFGLKKVQQQVDDDLVTRRYGIMVGQYKSNMDMYADEWYWQDEPFRAENSRLLSITLPSSITYIGDEALKECSTLPSIEIPSDVTYLGDFIISHDWNLMTITYKGVDYVCSEGNDADAYKLGEAIIGNGVICAYAVTCNSLFEGISFCAV